MTGPRRVAVIGGGVSGLTVAYRLTMLRPQPEVVVLEAGERSGGKIRSIRVGGLELPAGADSFLARKPWAADLARELGLRLVSPSMTGTYLWTETGLVRFPKQAAFGIPGDVGDVLRWPGLSGRGRRRALLDLVKAKRRSGGDETLGSLLRRRLGNEATDRAIAPLLAGLFAGNIDRLSVAATFPDLREWEREQGSLIRGSQAASRGAEKRSREPMFLAPQGGVDRLVGALADRLGPRVRTGAAAETLEPRGEAWLVGVAGGERVEADVVVMAVPAPAAARLLRIPAPSAASELDGIDAASTGVVLLVYEPGSQTALPEGTGFVVPRELAPMTACTWLSSKWSLGAEDRRAVVRCYVGGAGDEDVLDAPDEDLVQACARHLTAVLPLPATPEHSAVVRWPKAMPQYEVGHLDRVARIRAALPPSVFVAGQPYDGVGIPDCVRAAGRVADAIEALLQPVAAGEERIR